MSLWIASNYPKSTILSVSNSSPQCHHIREQAKLRGLTNITAMVADMNDFKPPQDMGPFDRVVSVEMFEHMRNWGELIKRIS